MPHTGFPRRNYGHCRRRLDLPKRRSLPGTVEIIQGNMKSVVQDVIEVIDRPRILGSSESFSEMRTQKAREVFLSGRGTRQRCRMPASAGDIVGSEEALMGATPLAESSSSRT